MNPLLPVSSISQINDFENYFQLFFKIFMETVFTRNKNDIKIIFFYHQYK